MRIAIPIDRLNPRRGGLERYVTELSRALSRRGHEVHIPCVSGLLPGDGVRLHRLSVQSWLGTLHRFGRAWQAWLRENPVDVSLGVGRSPGTDIYQAHGGLHGTSREALRRSGPRGLGRGLSRLFGALRGKDRYLGGLERQQILHPRTRRIVALSERSRRNILSAYPSLEGDVTVIPIGVDHRRFPPGDRERRQEEVRRRWGVPQGRAVGAFVGHHFRLKGLAPALEALALLPEEGRPHLLVAGRDRAHPFQRRAERLGLRSFVTFGGMQSGIEALLLGADLLLQPTFHDPCSHATLEAWAAGVPVVTTACNGAAELAKGSSAAIVVDDPWDVQALSKGIQEVLRRDSWPGRSEEARRIAGSHSFDEHVDEMESLFRQVSRREARTGAITPRG